MKLDKKSTVSLYIQLMHGTNLRQGIQAVLTAPALGIQNAIEVIAFVFIIGGVFQIMARTYKMFIPLLAAGIVYYLIVKLLSVFLRKFERRLKESD